VIFTGAGMSAESGIPTFRDRGTGLWENVDPLDVATSKAFRDHPQGVWDWHVHLADAVRQASPNAGHVAISELQKRISRVTVITQNIDNLHQEAGSFDVIELHGSLLRLKAFIDVESAFSDHRSPEICPLCNGYASSDDIDPFVAREDFEALKLQAGSIPRCPRCEALLRPDVVWFGEGLSPNALGAAWAAVDRCEALICVGTSLEVEPAAGMPWRALNRGAVVIEINTEPTSLSGHADAFFFGSAATVLPELFHEIFGDELHDNMA
jgi:NAD-dependent deacetylase